MQRITLYPPISKKLSNGWFFPAVGLTDSQPVAAAVSTCECCSAV